ncbi:MAG: ABC transporter permease, partial [Acidobacteriota bacterium]|nr:ABC transporter permease [Acidobacteriota bacterium]
MRLFWQELRYAVRRLSRQPVLTVTAVVAIAVGVGAVSAAWSVVDAVLLRPLPYAAPGKLVMVWERSLDGTAERVVTSLPNFLDWRSGSRSLRQAAAWSVFFPSLSGTERPEKLLGALVSADFFATLGVRPLLGRTFLASEDRPGAGQNVVVLS